ncbi:Bax inhibitor-1 family protein [Enterobacteriaceae bacterium LUAb1]
MKQYSRSGDSIVQQAGSNLQVYMAQVYGWMMCGLLLTAFVSWYAAHTPAVLQFIFQRQLTFFGLIIAQLVLVFMISGRINKMSGALATGLFMLYSALTGLTMSAIFIVYTQSSITSAFVVTAGMFGVMSFWGYTTKRDLSSMSSMLFMALVGMILASLVNIWLKSTVLMWVITYAGVVIFVGLTASDTQKLKNIGKQVDITDRENFRRYSITGALTLYLDFINLFMKLLRIFGSRR